MISAERSRSPGPAARFASPARVRAAAWPLALLVLGGLALLLGLHRLDAKSLWLDEVVSARYAAYGPSQLWRVVSGQDSNAGLFYVLLAGWSHLAGLGVVALRLPSVVFGAGAVAVTAALGRRLCGLWAGLLAGLLLAVNPMFVHFEQTARTYTLAPLLVLLSFTFLVEELREPTRVSRAGYIVSSALSIYAHDLTALALISQLVVVLAIERRRALTRRWALTAVAIAVLAAPEVVFAVRTGTVSVNWIPAPTTQIVLRMIRDVAGGSLVGVAMLVLAAGGLAVLSWRTGWRAAILASWVLVPIALDIAISVLGRPLTLPYYLLFVTPALALLAAAMLGSLPLPVRLGVLALVLLLARSGLHQWYQQGSQEDYRAATRYLLAHERPGDAIAYYPPYTAYGFQYYAARAGRSGPVTLPLTPGVPPSSRASRVWLALRDSQPSLLPRARSTIAAVYGPPRASVSFPDLTLVLYVRR